MTTNSPTSVVFAYSEVGYVCLEEMLRQGANVAAVFTHLDDPDENIWFRSVADLVKSHGLPLYEIDKLRAEDVELVRSISPDFIFSFYFRAMIPTTILECARRGAFNMHGALLPRYRGRACINWAVINGETETGATLHVMTAQADRGDIASQMAVPILHSDTAHDVFLKVADAAREILRRDLGSIFDGSIALVPQDESRATTFGRRTPADGEIDWTKSAEQIYDLVRGVTHPFPGAFTTFDGVKTFIWQARPVEGGDGREPGEIVSRAPFVVATGRGLLEIIRYQPDGEQERDA